MKGEEGMKSDHGEEGATDAIYASSFEGSVFILTFGFHVINEKKKAAKMKDY